MMAIMNIINLRGIDLNLLVVFHLLMQERNVTRAAAKLYVSQSAVSAALARLRTLFGDPLFVRERSGMVPTRRAIELAAPIARALGELADTINPEAAFSPTESTRTFHLAMSDDIESVVAPWLLNKSITENWTVKFAFHQTNSRLYEEALSDERIDLVICSTVGDVTANYRSKPLFSGSYLCVYSNKQRANYGPITEEEFREAIHLRVSFDAQRGFIDDLLESAGIQRRVPVSLTHFAGISTVLDANPAIVTLPDYAARALARACGLTTSSVPVTVPKFTSSMIWRVVTDMSSDHLWLQETVGSFELPPV